MASSVPSTFGLLRPAGPHAAARQALWTLRLGFAALPVLFGLDKFANILTADWTKYLDTQITDSIGLNAQAAMQAVGLIEIIAGLIVLVAPRIGGPLVTVWLLSIIADLLMVGGYGDVALRDFGLAVGALALTRLAWALPGDLFSPAAR